MTDGLLEVGRVIKPHGLNGEVVILLWSEVEDRLAPGVSLETERGPLTIETWRLHQGRHLVRFDGVRDRTSAEHLRGLVLSAEPREIPGALFVHELIGCQVELQDGTLVGTVAAVEANPASDLCVLEDGRLIPLRFVLSHEANVRMIIDPPDGLLDLAK